jgi:putative membrane protein
MSIIIKVFATLVALDFFYIMYLETFATTSDKTSQVFGMTKDELSRESVNVLFKNQGIYNGLISVLILLSVFVFSSLTAVMLLMGYIILVALYGAITINPKIIFMQGGLAIITLIVSIISMVM